MNEKSARSDFVRAAVIIGAVLLPFASYQIWDFVEMRRLNAALDAIVAKGEPIVPQWSRQKYEPGADRLYIAASIAASRLAADREHPLTDVAFKPESFDWSVESVDGLRRALANHQEGLTLLDHAAELPFRGFAPGEGFGGPLSPVLTMASARAAVRVADGDGDGAIDSIYAAARAVRALHTPFSAVHSQYFVTSIVERTRPSQAALERLAAALAEADDDRLRSGFLEQRAGAIDAWLHPGERMTWEDSFFRPVRAHELNQQLQRFERWIAAASEPWPSRIDRVIALSESPFPIQNVTLTEMLTNLVWSTAGPLAVLRANLVVVAIERYRRDHDEQWPESPQQLIPRYLEALPIDPFSGRPLLVKQTTRGYDVYSVGMNRRDDAGVDLDTRWTYSFPRTYPADLGVRVERR